MAFIAKQKVYGKEYYYLRKTKREGKKVKSVCLAYLEKTRKEAEKKAKEILKKTESVKEEKEREKKAGKLVKKDISIDELAMFCKKKGFVFRSSDIYGGFAGFWNFGPLGVELFNNIKKEWWDYFVKKREDMAGVEGSIISHPQIWEASGHVGGFNVNDILVVCKKCKKSSKVDKYKIKKIKCECGGEYDWDKSRVVEQMFKVNVGIDGFAYLRPETAQGMFTDFKLIQQASRKQLPFGIAQIGRCFRNEIAPRDFLFRSREFHIAEFEFFINPNEKKCDLLDKTHLNIRFNFLSKEAQEKAEGILREVSIKNIVEEKRLDEWHAYWLAEQILWLQNIGLKKEDIKIREHTKDELSHYSSATFDIDYSYPFGSSEIAGIANRGQFDLTQHQDKSKEKMEIFDEKLGKIIPRVIEPTFGIERIFLAVLTNAYYYDEGRENIVLKIPAKLAPIKAAVFPIVKQSKFEKISEKIVEDLKKDFNVVYDKGGSIGRRYARNDEIGTPFCITIDEQTAKDNTITIRDRDTTRQIRIKISEIKEIIRKTINGENLFALGKEVKTRKK